MGSPFFVRETVPPRLWRTALVLATVAGLLPAQTKPAPPPVYAPMPAPPPLVPRPLPPRGSANPTRQARLHKKEFAEKYAKLIQALNEFAEVYAKNKGEVFPFDKAKLVKQAWRDLQKVEPAFK